MKTRPPCLEWRERLALRHEDLSPADQQALDAHVQTCQACATALTDYHFFEARLDALPPPAIKPLPRLSPHFFEQSGKSSAKPGELEADITPTPVRARSAQKPRRNRTASIAWRTLGIVAVLCLLLASGLLFRTIYNARLATHPGGDTLLNLNQHTDLVYGVAWSPNGKEIATASADHTVKVWDAQSGSLICTYFGHSGVVYTLAWSPTGQEIASGGDDNTVQVWTFSPANGCASSPFRTYTGHTGVVDTLAWSPDGKEIVSGSWDHTAQVWAVDTGKTLLTFPTDNETVSSVAWSPDGKEIAVGSWDQYVRVWNAVTTGLPPVHVYRYITSAVNAVAWSPNGAYIAIGTSDGMVEVRTSAWNVVSDYTGHTGSIYGVAWSHDGQEIASASEDHTVRVWNPFTLKTLMVYSAHTADVWSVSWSPDGKEIVSGSWDHTAKVWKVVG